MDKVILKNKKKKKQPFEVENENRVNLIRNMDNHNVEEYHDYERMFHTKPYVEGVKAMDKIIIKRAQEEFKKEALSASRPILYEVYTHFFDTPAYAKTGRAQYIVDNYRDEMVAIGDKTENFQEFYIEAKDLLGYLDKEASNIKQAYNQFKKESKLNKKAEEEKGSFQITFYVGSEGVGIGDYDDVDTETFDGTYDEAAAYAKSRFPEEVQDDFVATGGDPESWEIITAYFNPETGDEISLEEAEGLDSENVVYQVEGFKIE